MSLKLDIIKELAKGSAATSAILAGRMGIEPRYRAVDEALCEMRKTGDVIGTDKPYYTVWSLPDEVL